MNKISSVQPRRARAILGAAECLSLAAAPSFAVMAALTHALGDGNFASICSAGLGFSWLGGMVPMYLLMSAFHLAAWLRLIATRRIGARGLDEQAGPVH